MQLMVVEIMLFYAGSGGRPRYARDTKGRLRLKMRSRCRGCRRRLALGDRKYEKDTVECRHTDKSHILPLGLILESGEEHFDTE